MGFRIGRGRAQHTYPENRSTTSSVQLANNFARGPATDTVVGEGGDSVPWDSIGSGAPAGVDVPITPRLSGDVRVIAAITLQSTSESPTIATIQAEVDHVTFGPLEQMSIPAGGFATIPLLAHLTGLTPGTTVPIGIFVLANAPVSIVGGDSTIDVQEITTPTG